MYTALVLDELSRNILMAHFNDQIPIDWDVKCHHMTINLNSAETGPASAIVGQEFELIVMSLGKNDKVMAVGVNTTVPSTNLVKHITLAVNTRQGGKPKDSNLIANWASLPPVLNLKLKGTIAELN